MFTSPTYGQVDNEQMIKIMRRFYDNHKQFDCPINLVIGTDSQSFDKLKVVTAVCMQCEGHGGIYFYRIERVDRVSTVMEKLNYETHLSLEYANELLSAMIDQDSELFESISFSIHVDAGHNPKGKTKELIPSLVGWINSYGYKAEVKPASWCASTIANKISK